MSDKQLLPCPLAALHAFSRFEIGQKDWNHAVIDSNGFKVLLDDLLPYHGLIRNMLNTRATPTPPITDEGLAGKAEEYVWKYNGRGLSTSVGVQTRKLMQDAFMDGYRAALTQQPQAVSGWLPISSANRDGTRIIVKDKLGHITSAYYNGKTTTGWFSDELEMEPIYELVEWMPLPPTKDTTDGN